jgi:hypothetical protein|tara:strand:+ start:163 stop:297 length:135 start_codon:yes stop_codon:yes gene_type:complete
MAKSKATETTSPSEKKASPKKAVVKPVPGSALHKSMVLRGLIKE